MKGIILAGGTGSRLFPCTAVTNKHLLPVFNKPMIYYPLRTLVKAGLTDIMIVSGKEHADHFKKLFNNNPDFPDINFNFAVQKDPGGIAQALGLARDFVKNEKIIVILGDNIFEDDISGPVIEFQKQEKGAKIFLKKVPDPERFGVAILKNEKIIEIEEKPLSPKSDLAVTGLYMYDQQVWDVISSLQPSGRGELEITDVNNFYVRQGTMTYEILCHSWTDAGTFASLLRANLRAAMIEDFDLKLLIKEIYGDEIEFKK
ncbi:NTP transferase domain-containing protein [Candidatus Falkowbacteria bacterium]|nr:NTP transferase domain-containing protein [Candidatus Falkowbacteria bacterium]